tara:strand:- start:69 stop:788 length:720 start_codon:yes stop_codon:yes gene_type:complete
MKNKIEKTTNILFLLLLVFVGVYSFIYTFKINLFKIDKILITGNQFIDNQTIENIINENIKNKNIYDVNLSEVNYKIEKNSFIQNVKTYTELPSTISIHINEINPVILYQEHNTYYLIDEKHKKIEADINAINFFSVPILTEYDNITQSDNKQIINSLKTLAVENHGLYNSINEIKIKNDNIFLIINKTTVKIDRGSVKDNVLKLLTFDKRIEAHNSIDSYKYIDLTIPNQIIVKDKII